MPGMSDVDLVAERRREDVRRFLRGACDPQVAPRLAPALLAMLAMLADRRWHPWAEVLAVGLRDTDIAVRTLEARVSQAVGLGWLARRGEWSRTWDRGARKWIISDARELRLIEWG